MARLRRWGAWWLRALALGSEYGWMVREAEDEAARRAAWEDSVFDWLATPMQPPGGRRGWNLEGVEILRMEIGFAVADPRAQARILPISFETAIPPLRWGPGFLRYSSQWAVSCFWLRPSWRALWNAVRYAFLAEWREHSR